MSIHFVRVLCALIALTLSSTSQAAILTATYTGTGDGNLGGVGFSGASFVITATYDTADVTNVSPIVLQVEHLSVSIDIDDPSSMFGFPPVTFITATRTFFSDSNDYVGLSHIGGLDLLDIGNVGLNGWNMLTPIGPVFDPAPIAINQFNGVQTTGGVLNFSRIIDSTFTVRGDVIPEPGTLGLLLACGLPLLRRRNAA